jgi:hypothetical protein
MSLKAIFQKYTMFKKYKKYTLADISNSGQELLFFFCKKYILAAIVLDGLHVVISFLLFYPATFYSFFKN